MIGALRLIVPFCCVNEQTRYAATLRSTPPRRYRTFLPCSGAASACPGPGATMRGGVPSLCGDLGDDPGAGSLGTLDAEAPAERLDAIGETAQARPSTRVSAAHAVIDDLDQQPACVALHPDPHQ